MDVINELEEILIKYPEVKYELKDGWLTVMPHEGGFPVMLTTSDRGTMVSWGGWHDDFADYKEAIDCFMSGLMSESRLKVFFRGNFEYKWVAETMYKEKWTNAGSTALIFYPFWKKKRIEYFQNNIVTKP